MNTEPNCMKIWQSTSLTKGMFYIKFEIDWSTLIFDYFFSSPLCHANYLSHFQTFFESETFGRWLSDGKSHSTMSLMYLKCFERKSIRWLSSTLSLLLSLLLPCFCLKINTLTFLHSLSPSLPSPSLLLLVLILKSPIISWILNQIAWNFGNLPV